MLRVVVRRHRVGRVGEPRLRAGDITSRYGASIAVSPMVGGRLRLGRLRSTMSMMGGIEAAAGSEHRAGLDDRAGATAGVRVASRCAAR